MDVVDEFSTAQEHGFSFYDIELQEVASGPVLDCGNVLPDLPYGVIKVTRGEVDVNLQVVGIENVCVVFKRMSQVVDEDSEQEGAKN